MGCITIRSSWIDYSTSQVYKVTAHRTLPNLQPRKEAANLSAWNSNKLNPNQTKISFRIPKLPSTVTRAINKCCNSQISPKARSRHWWWCIRMRLRENCRDFNPSQLWTIKGSSRVLGARRKFYQAKTSQVFQWAQSIKGIKITFISSSNCSRIELSSLLLNLPMMAIHILRISQLLSNIGRIIRLLSKELTNSTRNRKVHQITLQQKRKLKQLTQTWCSECQLICLQNALTVSDLTTQE